MNTVENADLSSLDMQLCSIQNTLYFNALFNSKMCACVAMYIILYIVTGKDMFAIKTYTVFQCI